MMSNIGLNVNHRYMKYGFVVIVFTIRSKLNVIARNSVQTPRAGPPTSPPKLPNFQSCYPTISTLQII
jgi:hypothetical protein